MEALRKKRGRAIKDMEEQKEKWEGYLRVWEEQT